MEIMQTLPRQSLLKNRYQIEDILGVGGFGAVYLVKDLRVEGNLFALKEVIALNHQEREHFFFECELLKRLDHPTLPHVYRFFEDESGYRAYMLMDYIDGPDLETLRQQQPEKRFSFPQVIHMMAPIIDALVYLHQQPLPIIHRDIKPANILIPASSRGGVLVDFGIAKEYARDSTTTTVRRCSPGYAAPEQYTSGTSPRTDIYGLAATLYTLLTGVVPPDALVRITEKEHEQLKPLSYFLPTIPPSAAWAIERGLAIDSKERFATIEQFWSAFVGQACPEYTAQSAHEPFDETCISTPLPAVMMPLSARASGEKVLPQSSTKKTHVLLALLAVSIGIVFCTDLFLLLPRSSASVSSLSLPASVVKPAIQTGHTLLPAIAGVANYPHLASSYSGILTNTAVSPRSREVITLTQLQQDGPLLHGTLTLWSRHSNVVVQGMLFPGNVLQLLASNYENNVSIVFTGQVEDNGTITGTYCLSHSGRCDNTYRNSGIWNLIVLPNDVTTFPRFVGPRPSSSSAKKSLPTKTPSKHWNKERDA